jgi:hypothetical protein
MVSIGAPMVVPHVLIDLECGDAPLASPRRAAHLEAASSPVDRDHCLLCHFQRNLRSTAIAEIRVDPVLQAVSIVRESPSSAPRTARILGTPPRAPPLPLI